MTMRYTLPSTRPRIWGRTAKPRPAAPRRSFINPALSGRTANPARPSPPRSYLNPELAGRTANPPSQELIDRTYLRWPF